MFFKIKNNDVDKTIQIKDFFSKDIITKIVNVCNRNGKYTRFVVTMYHGWFPEAEVEIVK